MSVLYRIITLLVKTKYKKQIYLIMSTIDKYLFYKYKDVIEEKKEKKRNSCYTELNCGQDFTLGTNLDDTTTSEEPAEKYDFVKYIKESHIKEDTKVRVIEDLEIPTKRSKKRK